MSSDRLYIVTFSKFETPTEKEEVIKGMLNLGVWIKIKNEDIFIVKNQLPKIMTYAAIVGKNAHVYEHKDLELYYILRAKSIIDFSEPINKPFLIEQLELLIELTSGDNRKCLEECLSLIREGKISLARSFITQYAEICILYYILKNNEVPSMSGVDCRNYLRML